MMQNPTIKELASRFKVAAGALKKLHLAGHLVNVTVEDDRAGQMRRYLGSRRPLSVEMLLALLREPDLCGELTVYESQARHILAGIGDPALGALPAEDWSDIIAASQNDADGLSAMVDWLQSIIPAAGCGYHWVGVRAMWHCRPDKFKQVYNRLPRALINARANPRMAGWSDASDGTTRFMRPTKLEYDL